MGEDTGWTRLAWQGIAFEMPGDWCPGQIQGDYASGYLRVEDELAVRLELRWETLGRKLLAAATLVENYLRQAQRKLRRREPRPRVDRDQFLRKLEPLDHEIFTWRDGLNAHSLIAVCGASRRYVHLRVFFEAGRDTKSLARRVFGSLRLSSGAGPCEWSVFDFAFRVGGSWRLHGWSLPLGNRPAAIGWYALGFRDGDDKLLVSRVSLAEIKLRRVSLKQWFGRFFRKDLRDFNCSFSEATYRDHPALHCAGRSSRLSRPLGILRRRLYVTALAWHCAEADKIFVVRAISRNADDARVRSTADTITCH